jgi:predicted DCC family thiol-disulfide oxidoreductase YuxK
MAEPTPILVYDGRCRICIRSATRLRRWVGDGLRLESFRDPGVMERHGLTPAQCESGSQLVLPDGRVLGGADGILHALALRPVLRPLVWLRAVPGLRQAIDAVYGVVVRNRFRLGGEVCDDGACEIHPRV